MRSPAASVSVQGCLVSESLFTVGSSERSEGKLPDDCGGYIFCRSVVFARRDHGCCIGESSPLSGVL